jgi:hypothetical protein
MHEAESTTFVHFVSFVLPDLLSDSCLATCSGLEVESDLGRQGARRHIVRPAEGGKEVVECVFVRDVDGGELQADFVLVAMKYVVVPHRDVEKIPRCNAGRILVVVLGVRRRHLQKRGTEL